MSSVTSPTWVAQPSVFTGNSAADIQPDQNGEPVDVKALANWWHQARAAHADNRAEQATDEDFSDGIQWSPDQRQILEQRGQVPLTFNEIKPAINYLLGLERRNKVDFAVHPREPGDADAANAKQQLLKYLSDVNRFSFVRSQAFSDAVRAGVGWLEVGVRNDPTEEPIFVRAESWRSVWLDPHSVAPDLGDARYLCRSKILDLDTAIAMFPQHEGLLKQEAGEFQRLQSDAEFYDTFVTPYQPAEFFPLTSVLQGYDARKAVRLIECWYRKPMAVKRITGKFTGLYDSNNAAHQLAVTRGLASLHDAIGMVMHVAFFTQGEQLLFHGKSPYRHNTFPFVPLWAYRRGTDSMPYGAVRNARDAQLDLNKRRSKALFLLSTNKVIIDRQAVEDPEAFEADAASPDQIVWIKPGSRVEFLSNAQLADGHVQMGLQDGEYIRQITGVTAENLGLETNAISGKAILAKQTQGTVATADLFDNLRLATQLAGEILLSLVEQFYNDAKVFRILGDKGAPDFVAINQPDGYGQTLNDITASQADFVVAEQDFHETQRRASFELLMQTATQLPPEVSVQLLDLVIDSSDLPNKATLVERIRRITGQTDPTDPQAAQAAQAEAQAQAQQATQDRQMAVDRQIAELQELYAKTQKLLTDAALSQAKADELNQPGQQYRVTTPLIR